MNTVSLKMPETLAIRLEETARRKGVSKSTLIREALEAYLQTDRTEHPESALSRAAGLVGVLSGPELVRKQGLPAGFRSVIRHVVLDTGPLAAR